MNNFKKSLCFSGHRTDKLPKKENIIMKLKENIYIETKKYILYGINTFYFGGCYGFDIMCAEIVIELKKIYNNIKLIGVIPFKGQENLWKEEDKLKYKNIISLCDEVIILNNNYKKGCYYERNRYIVDKSNYLICYCRPSSKGGTKYTINYAIEKGIEIKNLYKKGRY